ncbi:ATP-grasp domain-containing protein [Streptomyces asoensis]|uniref:ATP-grasp domain-containing protein n=1 Tax=Streptomyces asoensis TaxID=249586 RepID=UPI0033E4DEDA
MLLLLNNKPILHRVPEWFPQARQELIVVSTRSGLGTSAFAELARSFRHLHLVSSLDRPGLEEDLVALCRRFGVRRVLSTGEREVLPAATLRERLGLPGQDVACATAYRDKYTMKSLLTEAGIPVAPMRRLASPADLDSFAAEAGLPVVVKRRLSGGSNGTRVLWDGDALKAFTGDWAACHIDAPDLAEAWVEGDFYHINGLMRDGRIVLAQPSYQPYSDWFSVAYDAPGMSGMMPDEDPMSGRLRATAAKVVATMPAVPGVCAFQVEFFHTPDDRLVVCETACRAGGSRMVETHEDTLGVHLHGASLLGQAGRSDQVTIRPTGRRQGYARFPSAQGVLRHLPRRSPLPQTLMYTATGEEGRHYDPATSLGSSVAEIVVSLTGPDTAAELLAVETWWESAVVWQDRRNPVPDRFKSVHRVRPDTRERALHV